MITLKPFKGLRPKKDLYSKTVVPPYDVLSHKDCKKLAENNPYSLIHITRSEVDLHEGINAYSKEVYEKSKENLDDFIKKGYLVSDDTPCFYIYREIMGKHKQVGFVGLTSVYEYEKNIIKKHEKTRKDKEEDRINHIEITNCQAEPVFLTYRSRKELDEILERIDKTTPEIEITTDDGVSHAFWVVKDKNEIEKIKTGFKNTDFLYVADGHHRTAASLAVAKKHDSETGNTAEKEYQFFLSVIFPHNNLQILPYNRAVRDLNGNTEDEFVEKIKKHFTIEEVKSNDARSGFKPEKPKQIGMYFKNKWFLLKAKESIMTKDPVKSLDVSILQDYILSPILGIEDPRTDRRIDFFGGIKGTEILRKVVESKEFVVSFSMFPTSMEELLFVADANQLMPPKSTWFEPKLKSGMVLHNLD